MKDVRYGGMGLFSQKKLQNQLIIQKYAEMLG